MVEQREQLLRRFIAAAVDGTVTGDDIKPDLPRELVAKGWRACVAMLSAESSDVDLVRALHVLHAADPCFPSAHFLLGLAHFHAGAFDHARLHFTQQMGRAENPHQRECRGMLKSMVTPADFATVG